MSWKGSNSFFLLLKAWQGKAVGAKGRKGGR